jgi:preprotein translocase subunit YajC
MWALPAASDKEEEKEDPHPSLLPQAGEGAGLRWLCLSGHAAGAVPGGLLALAIRRHHDSRATLFRGERPARRSHQVEDMFESPAYAAAAGSPPGGGAGLLMSIAPLLFIFVIFYFLLIRPQQRRLKAHQDMVAAVKLRDTAVTSGGLIGKVTKVDETEVELEVAPNVRVRIVKSMLQDVRPHGQKPAND